jgi:alanine-glyoxylate transaminase/serine-glyoxylate transaminase/serine-pyruvate transaminase
VNEFNAPFRILLGPGPSNVDPRVLRALSQSLVSHMDPAFEDDVMDNVQEGLRKVFEADHALTLPISGTGTAGMETALVNMIEPGDPVLICTAGFFANRMGEIAERIGGKVTLLKAEWGRAFEPDEISRAIDRHKPKVVGLVHVETSTGVAQPLEPLREIWGRDDIVTIVDAVASLGGQPISVAENRLDFVYSGSQKCLSCPPGLAPVSLSDKAVRRLEERGTPVRSWYLDLTLLGKYWRSTNRVYHHTAPISLNYAMREALRMIEEEGLGNRFCRHRQNHLALVAGVEAMGLAMFAKPDLRAWTVNTVRVPEGIDDARVREQLLEQYGIEIVGGQGPLTGKIWRIGLMGSSSTRNNILLLLAALEDVLTGLGHGVEKGAGVAAAIQCYQSGANA